MISVPSFGVVRWTLDNILDYHPSWKDEWLAVSSVSYSTTWILFLQHSSDVLSICEQVV
jgi:hypothetical protein